MILDWKQAVEPSCKSGKATVAELVANGVDIKRRRPVDSFYSSNHEKTWVFDDQMYLCGSMNSSTNSIEYCEEAGTFTRDVEIVKQAVLHF